MSLLTKLFGNKSDISGSSTEAEGVLGAVSRLFDKNEKEIARLRPLVESIGKIGEQIRSLSDDELKGRSTALRQKFRDEVTARLQKEGLEWLELDEQHTWTDAYNKSRLMAEKEVLEMLLPEAFALVREASDRTIGLRHFDVQMIGGAVLHSGKIAEMRTGEGKTLVATSPAYLNALTGRGVHCVTVNDYLAERDANWMRPIYEFLGLTVAFLQNDMESDARQAAYSSDILYGTNSEFGFDYLRDNMARSAEDMVQKPLNFAIIDEVDNILIDEARTPLIISAQVAKTDRALRRQQMSTTCDTVARQLMPAVNDREVEAFIDGFSDKGRVNVGELANAIFGRGAFKPATDYLIDAYLVSDKSARTENSGRLLDAADELFADKLISEAGRTGLEKLALAATKPQELHSAWREEIERILEPFEVAFLNGQDGDFNAQLLAHDLTLSEEIALEIEPQIEQAADKENFGALIIADEMARRGLIENSAIDAIAAALKNGRDAFRLATLEAPGHISDADKILRDNVPEGEVTAASTRKIVAALEATDAILPFETAQRLWSTVQLPQGRDGLRKEIAKAIETQSGEAALKIRELTNTYGTSRAQFLKGQAATLKTALGKVESVAKLAENGENAEVLQKALQRELAKSGSFSQATKAATGFVKEQNKAYDDVANHLIEEMTQWVEIPRDAKKVIVSLLAEGGRQNEVTERLNIAVRDLPGDASELGAIAADGAARLQEWRHENAISFVEKINALTPLPDESKTAIQTSIEDGTFASNGFEEFVGNQLLSSPEIAPLSGAVEAYGTAWDAFKAQSNAKLVDDIAATHEMSADAKENLGELLSRPLSGALDKAIYGVLSADVVARHLEPLLNADNAPAFTDEVKRRIPLSKDVANKLRAGEFDGRSAEQLSRALQRLVVRSLEAMPFEDYKRVVKNLGWLTEKDEKRRTAAVTDMGTLVAEREAARPVFTDPDGFLDTLLQGEILTEEEAEIAKRAQIEAGDETLTSVIDRVLRLPAERRRRLAEAKLQEVQPILDQGIKAHALFEYNVNYVIGGGKEIVIVDEFTGRTMPGRRFSEGLHEALEAKHGLEVQIESQTVATITIQNYFRLYNKISGLTGTAKTEETEFAKTYGMEVVTVPTNRPARRKDAPDVVYKTAEAKLRAITFDVLEHHCAGQPVLVGTRSVEMSERMAQRLSANALQTLVLSHLIKDRLWNDKAFPAADKEQLFTFVRQPLLNLNPVQVKGIAKQINVNPDVTAPENIDKLISLFTLPNIDRNLLTIALKQGLAHNVLNAKNHRNEARIIAEAARPGAVTIATNMAGRGVDIILGGSLDSESRWRVLTQQTLARNLEGKQVHVRSRNVEASQQMAARYSPDALQTLAWAVANQKTVEDLEKSKSLEGQAAKELRDALGGDLTSADFANRVRSRARRFNLLDKLPVDLQPLDDRIVSLFAAELGRLMGGTYEVADLKNWLEHGIGAQEHMSETASIGLDGGQLALLFTLARPMAFSQEASEKLLDILSEIPDLDRHLLELVAAGGNLQPEALAANLGVVTPEWVAARLLELGAPNAQAATDRLGDLKGDVIEVNEFQIAQLMGEQFMGTPWLRERLSSWEVIGEARGFAGTEEMQQAMQDADVVHLRLDKKALAKKRAAWTLPNRRRDMVGVEAPNLILLQELAGVVGEQAPILNPEWLHHTLAGMNLITDEDVMQAQMMAQVQDENGQDSVQPIDVLVYRLRLAGMLEAIKPVIREAATQVGEEPLAIEAALANVAPWLPAFVDADWYKKTLAETPAELPAGSEAVAVKAEVPDGALVTIETGVAGQSTDIVLENEARPEDIAHTSDRDEVTDIGGLHIIGTERHESRRIDNQLRGRAGRQGDPGSSRFYISLDDELWRLFGTRGQFLLKSWDEDEPVEAGVITKQIERAQKKVELNHFEGRKQTLQYDDVMNVQREVVYRERRRALQGEDIRDTVVDMATKAALAEAEKHAPRDVRSEEWDTRKLYLGLGRLFGLSSIRAHVKEEELEDARWVERAGNALGNPDYDFVLPSGAGLFEIVEKLYEERENALGTDQVRGLERWQVMRSIDEHWMEHLAEMDYLRDAIWQQGYAQKEPIGVYRQEGFGLFQKMLGEIRREVTEAIFAYDIPDFEHEEASPELGQLMEARLIDAFPSDDGMEDGFQPDKDADGEDGSLVINQHTRGGIESPNNRAQRRANKGNQA
jgi:preprotein translocase subunit SecA